MDMRRSVLLLSDQAVGRFPDHCVRSGVQTQMAAKMTAFDRRIAVPVHALPGVPRMVSLVLGVSAVELSLPVTEAVWKRWRRRELFSSGIAVFGAVLAGYAAFERAAGGATVAVIFVVIGLAYRVNARARYWVHGTVNRSDGTAIVWPTHSEFDDDARRLYEQSLS